MADFKFKLNSAGVRELLTSGEMSAVCEQHAASVLGRCGEGYAMNTMVGATRVNAMVYAETKEALQDNLQNNTLLKALG